jgi:hypothetical protein
MAQIAKKTKRYPSDLTDEEWERIVSLMPKSAKRGRRRATDFREIINAVRYLVRGRPAATVQLRVLKFQGISASMSLLGHRLAMRSRVSVAHA